MADLDAPELAYLGNRADDGFDLPRFTARHQYQPSFADVRPTVNTYPATSPYSSNPHASLQPPIPQSAVEPSTYSTLPPSMMSNHPAATAQHRHQSRLSQIVSDPVDTQGASLNRSTSLGGRLRGHHSNPSDDIERAYPPQQQEPLSNSQRQLASSFYPPALGFSAPNQSESSAHTQDYMSYGPRRSNTQMDPSTPIRAPTSTAKSSANDGSQPGALDSPQHGYQTQQYLPPPSSYADPYTVSLNTNGAQSPAQQVKTELSSPLGPYVQPPMTPTQSGHYNLPYKPDPSSSSDNMNLDPNSSRRSYLTSVRTGGSASTPNTPLSYPVRQSPQPMGQQYYPLQQQQPPQQQFEPPRRRIGLRRVREARDLKPQMNLQPQGRRADPSGNGAFLSPLKSLTTHISQTYNICNPQFRYETSHNPRRVLTKPSKPVHNEGYDNEDYDYILYVNDWLGAEDGQNKYLILDVLGQGTFGQVVKCQNMKTHEIVAVKVVKNKPAYFNQSMMEVTILELLNNTWDPHDEHHILRLRDTFIHRKHLCLVFELLSSNLYELIKQNSFGGLSTQLVKVFTAQLLDALTILNEARLIHCDLKPENILLKSLQSPQIKVIDFGSACHERQTVYTYIQSRFYRSPEVLLGLSYTSAIDMWSLGCIAVELFLGLPLFPGTSEYNQITRIVEMLGMPPTYMLEMGKQANQFFSTYIDEYGRKKFRLKPIEQYSRERGTQEQPGKKYFSANTLPEIIRSAPHPKATVKPGDVEKEAANRTAFIDFVQGLLNLNPIERWSPQQARLHPFITGEKFTKPYVPAGNTRAQAAPLTQSQAPPTNNAVDPKRPYGGLVPSQPKGTRAYQDAATYNQHLAQHQAYTAQAASQQAANNAFRNPYVAAPSTSSYDQNLAQQQPQSQVPPQQQQQRLQHQNSAGQLRAAAAAQQQQQQAYPPAQSSYPPSGPPTQNTSGSYYPPTSRTRANTINQMDIVPPAIARIANMGMDVSGIGRNTLTPVLNREEAMREWEQRQSGRQPQQPVSYPQLEYLQQQAELHGWNQPNTNRYAPHQPSQLHFQAPPVAVIVDSQEKPASGLREVTMSTSRSVGRYDQAGANSLPTPAQAYAGSSSSNRFPATFQQPTVPYDTYDHRDGMGTLYIPLQPHQYQSYGSPSSPSHGAQQHQGSTSSVSSNTSLYGSSVVAAGPQSNSAPRNPFSAPNQSNVPGQDQSRIDPRPLNDADIWPR